MKEFRELEQEFYRKKDRYDLFKKFYEESTRERQFHLTEAWFHKMTEIHTQMGVILDKIKEL